jgi:hypothetical protein
MFRRNITGDLHRKLVLGLVVSGFVFGCSTPHDGTRQMTTAPDFRIDFTPSDRVVLTALPLEDRNIVLSPDAVAGLIRILNSKPEVFVGWQGNSGLPFAWFKVGRRIYRWHGPTISTQLESPPREIFWRHDPCLATMGDLLLRDEKGLQDATMQALRLMEQYGRPKPDGGTSRP